MYQRHLIKRKWRRFLYIASFILAILSPSGCSDVQTVGIATPDTPSPLPLTPTRETTRPTITSSSIATATVQPTWTPVATLPVEIRKQNLIELFSTNGGCDFPCWWGVSPNDPIQKIHALAPMVGEPLRTHDSFHYFILSLDNLNSPDLDVGFHIDANQIVQNMEIRLGEPSRFKDYYEAFEAQLSLASVLGRYGKPSEVLFLVQPRFEPGETPRSYTLFIIYNLESFGVVYSGLVDSEDPLQVCSIKLDNHYLQSISLYLQDPRSKIAEINRFNSTDLFPLDQVTSMNLEKFYRIFSDRENNQCIEVPVDVWQ